jgi:hypothetical protein
MRQIPNPSGLSDAEIALWSACLGVYLCYAVMTSAYAIYHRSMSGLQSVVYVLRRCPKLSCRHELMA